MALASEDEWETDPELKQMRKDFVASFEGRRLAIEAHCAALGGKPGEPSFAQALAGVTQIAHKLAGAAETYGFPTLTRASSAFEDWSGSSGRSKNDRLAHGFALLLVELLKVTQERGKDAAEFAKDERLRRLLELVAQEE